MKKNWKTTAIGFLTAVCYVGYKFLTKQPVTGEDLTLAAGMIGIGAVSKDFDVTGGSVPSTTEAKERIKE
ncbi:MAG: hypothetical protein V4608_03420 [Bacteroidota bacterium]